MTSLSLYGLWAVNKLTFLQSWSWLFGVICWSAVGIPDEVQAGVIITGCCQADPKVEMVPKKKTKTGNEFIFSKLLLSFFLVLLVEWTTGGNWWSTLETFCLLYQNEGNLNREWGCRDLIPPSMVYIKIFIFWHNPPLKFCDCRNNAQIRKNREIIC